MQVGQLAHVAGEESAALALGFGGLTDVPHVKVDDQLPPALEDREQWDRSVRAEKLDSGVYLHHRQKSSSRRDRIAFAGVCLFPNSQSVQFCLPDGPVDHGRQRRSVEAFGEMVLIRCMHRCLLLSSPCSRIQDARDPYQTPSHLHFPATQQKGTGRESASLAPCTTSVPP